MLLFILHCLFVSLRMFAFSNLHGLQAISTGLSAVFSPLAIAKKITISSSAD